MRRTGEASARDGRALTWPARSSPAAPTTAGRRCGRRPALNGIDFLEVADLAPGELDADEAAEYASLPVAERDRLLWERRLSVAFVNPLTPSTGGTDAGALRISGGERLDSRNIGVAVLAVGADGVVVRATRSGDFSTYRLSLVASALDATPPAGFDPLLSAVDFSFKVDCPSDFDCRRATSVRPTSGRRSTSTISPATTRPSGG